MPRFPPTLLLLGLPLLFGIGFVLLNIGVVIRRNIAICHAHVFNLQIIKFNRSKRDFIFQSETSDPSFGFDFASNMFVASVASQTSTAF